MLRQIGESKIGLNFSNHGQIGAVTNRVIETIVSGTVLFSSSESVLKEFLRPEIDYVVFTDEQELMQKIESLLSDNVRLAEISMAASASIALRYSAEKFVSFIERLK
jgi:spore maturation protein CgeB